MYVTGTLMPKYGGAAAFTTAAFFQELWLFCGIICGNYAQYGLMSAATSIPVVVGGMLVIRLVASRVVHTAFWSTAGSWACSICLSAGPVSALHLLWLTS